MKTNKQNKTKQKHRHSPS